MNVSVTGILVTFTVNGFDLFQLMIISVSVIVNLNHTAWEKFTTGFSGYSCKSAQTDKLTFRLQNVFGEQKIRLEISILFHAVLQLIRLFALFVILFF